MLSCVLFGTWLVIGSNQIGLVSENLIGNVQFFRNLFPYLFIAATAFLLIIIILYQKETVIYHKGILHKGVFWGWSDIKDYKWPSDIFDDGQDKPGMNENTFIELVLVTKKTPFWTPAQLQVILPYRVSGTIKNLLIQSIQKQK
jgi:hypothetical protein